MTERDYERMLETVQHAMSPPYGDLAWFNPADVSAAANDNDVEWTLVPFPEGWHASP